TTLFRSGGGEIGIAAIGDGDGGEDREAGVAFGAAVDGGALVGQDAAHFFLIVEVIGEGAHFLGDFGRCGVGDAGEERGEGGGGRAALRAVVIFTRADEEGCEIAEAQRDR